MSLYGKIYSPAYRKKALQFEAYGSPTLRTKAKVEY